MSSTVVLVLVTVIAFILIVPVLLLIFMFLNASTDGRMLDRIKHDLEAASEVEGAKWGKLSTKQRFYLVGFLVVAWVVAAVCIGFWLIR